jgi:hypothetical protein
MATEKNISLILNKYNLSPLEVTRTLEIPVWASSLGPSLGPRSLGLAKDKDEGSSAKGGSSGSLASSSLASSASLASSGTKGGKEGTKEGKGGTKGGRDLGMSNGNETKDPSGSSSLASLVTEGGKGGTKEGGSLTANEEGELGTLLGSLVILKFLTESPERVVEL